MSELVVASSEADANAAEAVKQHHAVLAGALRQRTEALFAASSHRDTAAAEIARRDLVDWCERELVPHARAQEQAMCPAARATVEGRLLVEGMLGKHEVLTRLLGEVAEVVDLRRAAASAVALRAVFDSHLTKENDLVVPLLASTPGISAAALLGGMRQLLGGATEAAATEAGDGESGCGGHTCSCGVRKHWTMTALARAPRRTCDGPGHPVLALHPDGSRMADAPLGFQLHALVRGRERVGCHV